MHVCVTEEYVEITVRSSSFYSVAIWILTSYKFFRHRRCKTALNCDSVIMADFSFTLADSIKYCTFWYVFLKSLTLHAGCSHASSDSSFSSQFTSISRTVVDSTMKPLIDISLTFVSLFNESVIDVVLLGVFQDVEETQVDSVRLFQEIVQQRLSGFNWAIAQRLNWLQLSECQRVSLIHVGSHDTCVQLNRQFRVQRTENVWSGCAQKTV